MAEPLDLEELRRELADAEEALEGSEGKAREDAERSVRRLNELIAVAQNPVGMTVDGSAEEVGEEGAGEFRPAPRDLVVVDREDPNELFRVLDRHDEDQIVEEFQRRALKVMLYDFEQGGKRLMDLSYQGVNEAVRLLNATGKVRIGIDRDAFGGRGFLEEQVMLDGKPHVQVTVYAKDEATGYGQFGRATQALNMELRNGKSKPDSFAWTKALNKAQRNALKVMVPETIRQTLIAQFKGDEVALKQIKAGPGAESIAELPPPLTDERATELKNEARAVFQEIREVSKTLLLPAAFHAYLTRSEHSHERLEEFVEYLRQRLGEAKGAAA